MNKMFTGLRRNILGALVAFAAAFIFSTFGGDVAHAAGEKYFKNEMNGPSSTVTGTGGIFGDTVVKFEPAQGRPASTIYSTTTFLYKVGGDVRYPYSDCWYWMALTVSGNKVLRGDVGVTIPGVKNNIEGIQLKNEERDEYIRSCNNRARRNPGPGNPQYVGIDSQADLTVYNPSNPPPANDPDGDGKPNTDQPQQEEGNCSGGLVGWLICPLIHGLSAANGLIVNVMESLLVLKPLSFEQSDPLYIVWSLIRNLANLLFVLFFLFIIFSQATSIGLSNYGIKTILPKLIAAAILVNTSYFISAIFIDVINITMSGISSIIQAGTNAIPNSEAWSTGAGIGMGVFYTAVIAVIIKLMTTPLGPAIGFFILGVMLAGLGAIITGFVIIIVRDIIVSVGAGASALMFLYAMLARNGWKPIKVVINAAASGIVFIAIFDGAQFLAKFVGRNGVGNLDDGTWITPIVMFVIMITPFAAMPIVIKLIGNIGQKVGAWTNNRSKGWRDGARNRQKNAFKLGQGEIASNYEENAQGAGRLMNAGRRLATGTVGGFSSRSQARARSNRARLGNAFENEEIKLVNDEIEQRGIQGDKAALEAFARDSKSEYGKMAAMRQLGEIGAADKLQNLLNSEDPDIRRAAAKSIATSSKIRTDATGLYFQGAAYNNNRIQGKSEEVAMAEAIKVRNDKIIENMSAQHLKSQKPDQVGQYGNFIDSMSKTRETAADGSSIVGTSQQEKAIAAFKNSMRQFEKSPQTLADLTQESRKQIEKAYEDILQILPDNEKASFTLPNNWIKSSGKKP